MKHDSENILVEVKDSGIGISKEMLPTIFDEFKQADGSLTRQYEGTGLGLAISKKLITILGGDIEVKSQLDKGSVFTITIPIKWSIVYMCNLQYWQLFIYFSPYVIKGDVTTNQKKVYFCCCCRCMNVVNGYSLRKKSIIDFDTIFDTINIQAL